VSSAGAIRSISYKNEFMGADRRHHDLFEGADLALANDRKRGPALLQTERFAYHAAFVRSREGFE
jgi:hypothetical protein